MTITAGAVIDGVRDMHSAFTPEDFSNAILRRFLTRYQHELAGKIIRVRPQVLSLTSLVTALPLATFANGIAVPARLYVRDCYAQLVSDATFTGQVPVTLIAATTRFAPGSFPNAILDGSTLTLNGVDKDWVSYGSVTLRYAPLPASLAGDTTALILPDESIDTCIQKTAAFCALRAVGLPGSIDIDPTMYAQIARDAEADFLGHLTDQFRAEATRIIEVW